MDGRPSAVPATFMGLLRCPHCAGDLEPADRSFGCANGHNFDVARQGYLNLLPGNARPGTGDTAAMVHAREVFLDAGHYRAIDAAVTAAAVTALDDGPDGRPGSYEAGCCIELGAGTGHYLFHVLEAMPGRTGLALDISKHAARRAARAHPRLGAVVCDSWAPLPVRSTVAAIALSVFAPRNGAELARVLRPGGALIVVTPTAAHLAELVHSLDLITVDDRKQERLDRQLAPFLTAESTDPIEQVLHLPRRDVEALVGMGPSARHMDSTQLRTRIETLPDPARVTVSVMISRYRRS